MDKETAIALLDGAEATTKTWEVADDSVHKTWGILVSGHEIYWVASGRMPPTRPEAALIAAAPQLARWGIELTEEIDRLRAELAQARAELASFRALVIQFPQALTESIPKLVALLAAALQDRRDNPCAVGCDDTLKAR